MSIRDLVLAGLLMGMGLVLHAVFPGILGGMKPDFSLLMLFVVMMVIPDRRIAIIAGVVTGVLTALTTTFPLGQIPNIVDKGVTTAAVLGMLAVTPKNLKVPVIGVLGTIVSGTAFLTTALVLTGLPAPFTALFIAVVLPATVGNTLGLAVFYPIVAKLYDLQSQKAPSGSLQRPVK
ncbi:MAG: tryptophan transporter [Firmicutes bacterium]|nr:tryptophan transporter [Bacillota bacterium]